MSPQVGYNATAAQTTQHLRMSKRGGRCEAHLLDGERVIGTLSGVGAFAFTVRLPDGSSRSVKHANCEYVISELSL